MTALKTIYTDRRRLLALGGAVVADCALGSVIGLNAGSAVGARAADHAKLPIGMNLAGISDYNGGFPFLNLMWGSREWLTRNAAGDGPFSTGLTEFLELDENGYPLEVPFKAEAAGMPQHVFTILPNTLKAGKFVVLYDGVGEFGAGLGTKILSSRKGRVEISMTHNGDLIETLIIRKSLRGNHVRNIRVLGIADEGADLAQNPFKPELIEFCKPWHCLRFMDWLATNNSIDRRWSDRKRLSFYTQVGTNGDAIGLYGTPLPAWKQKWSSGVAIELCIQLANVTKTDAWLCVPHLADDDYIRQMAELVKAQLDPALRVYVEFSNELWNWQFMQSQWMLRSEVAGDLVEKAGAPAPWEAHVKPSLFADGITLDQSVRGADHPERIGALFSRCFRIWENVFNGRDRARLVRVCAVQAAWTDTVQRTLKWTTKNGGCDVLAPAGYFAPNDDVYKKWDAAGSSLTKDDVIADMRPMIVEAGQWLKANAAIARAAGVKLAIYEGGQHIQPQAQMEKPYNSALGAAQKDPAMYDLYRENMDLYAKEECGLFCAYMSVGAQGSRFGSWGHVEYYGQAPSEAPKYRAILDANARR